MAYPFLRHHHGGCSRRPAPGARLSPPRRGGGPGVNRCPRCRWRRPAASHLASGLVASFDPPRTWEKEGMTGHQVSRGSKMSSGLTAAHDLTSSAHEKVRCAARQELPELFDALALDGGFKAHRLGE